MRVKVDEMSEEEYRLLRRRSSDPSSSDHEPAPGVEFDFKGAKIRFTRQEWLPVCLDDLRNTTSSPWRGGDAITRLFHVQNGTIIPRDHKGYTITFLRIQTLQCVRRPKSDADLLSAHDSPDR